MSSGLPLLMGILQRTKSPWKRLEILARAVRQLRDLSPEERYRLALQVGVEGGAEAIEALAEGDEDLKEKLLLVLREAGGTDPAKLRRFLSDLRDPNRRAATLRESARTAGDHLLSSLVPEPPALPAASAPAVTVPRPEPPRMPPLAAPPPPPAPAPPPPTPTPIAAEAAPSPPPHAVTHRAAEEPAERPAPRVVRPFAAGDGAPSRHHDAPATSAHDAATLAATLREQPRLLRRFRLLRQTRLRSASVQALGEILDAFPDGWARRRALQWLLDQGHARDPDELVALLEHLDRRSDRRYCLRSLFRSKRFSADEQQLVRQLALENAPN